MFLKYFKNQLSFPHLDQCHHLHHSFLLCHLKCNENIHTMTMKEEHPMTLQDSCSLQYIFHILIILSWHYFQVCNISLKNAPLILSISSFPSFGAMGYKHYSQFLSSHKSITISNLACVHRLLSTWCLS